MTYFYLLVPTTDQIIGQICRATFKNLDFIGIFEDVLPLCEPQHVACLWLCARSGETAAGQRRLRPAARPHAMTRRKHPTSSVLANLLRLAESRSVRESQQDSIPKPKSCEGRATLGHRPTNIQNR